MAENHPSHGRLLNRFNAIGPYLRKPQSNPTCYFFDCLSECADVQLEPEQREFYGWWMKLIVVDASQLSFEYNYDFGFYDQQGQWLEHVIPERFQQSVQQTLTDFYGKLIEELGQLNISIRPSPDLAPSEVLAA
ncbi:sigma factor-binding protein Crl [Celerinatantimonas yamalensis]|uniref:Sigma factor-binding protein Crl n=1 Tax=Celerinatantimonas yamalensis TaxID=559956 RepID=A0ABW9G9G0_9GAMM